MRTIIVIFTDKKVSFNEAASYKRYKFFNGSWKKTINNAGYFIRTLNCMIMEIPEIWYS